MWQKAAGSTEIQNHERKRSIEQRLIFSPTELPREPGAGDDNSHRERGKRRVFSSKGYGIGVAVIAALTTIIIGYWQFVYKRANSNSNEIRQKSEAEGNVTSESRKKGRVPNRKSYNATLEFSSEVNGGVWAYGYRPKLESEFVLFFDKQKFDNKIDWWGQDRGGLGLLHNSTNQIAPIGTVAQLPPGMLHLHPGVNGEYCVLRWNAPDAGDYRIEVNYQGLNLGEGGTTSNLVILHNETAIEPNIEIRGYNLGNVVREVSVKANDRIDFCVGWGSNKSYDSDSTGLSVRITSVYDK